MTSKPFSRIRLIVLRRFGIPLVVAAMLAVGGGHWAVLQVVAWAGMAVSYTQTFGLGEGLSRTFGGENPCGLCLKIEEGRGKDDRQSPVRVAASVKLEAVAGRVLEVPNRVPEAVSDWLDFCPSFSGPGLCGPDTPPPRAA